MASATPYRYTPPIEKLSYVVDQMTQFGLRRCWRDFLRHTRLSKSNQYIFMYDKERRNTDIGGRVQIYFGWTNGPANNLTFSNGMLQPQYWVKIEKSYAWHHANPDKTVLQITELFEQWLIWYDILKMDNRVKKYFGLNFFSTEERQPESKQQLVNRILQLSPRLPDSLLT